MSNNGKHKRPFILTEELEQKKLLKAEPSKELSRSSGRDCYRRRVQMVVSRSLSGRGRH